MQPVAHADILMLELHQPVYHAAVTEQHPGHTPGDAHKTKKIPIYGDFLFTHFLCLLDKYQYRASLRKISLRALVPIHQQIYPAIL